MWHEALLTLCANGKVSEFRICLQCRICCWHVYSAKWANTQESTQKHISKVRAERERERETRIERKKNKMQNCMYHKHIYYTHYTIHMYVDGYLCAFVFAPKICRNIRNILLGTRALLWCHLNMLWNFSIEAAKCQKERERERQRRAKLFYKCIFFPQYDQNPFKICCVHTIYKKLSEINTSSWQRAYASVHKNVYISVLTSSSRIT